MAEFSALREEIQNRVRAQQNLLSLQLTITAAVFGFAVSQPGMTTLLLLVPFSSYLLCGRLVAEHYGTLRAAQYIMEELSVRVPGGLGWEGWLRRESRGAHMLGLALPLLLTFVAPGLISLFWTIGVVFLGEGVAVATRLGLTAVWVLGVVATGVCAVLVLQQSGTFRGRRWEHAYPA